MDQQTGFTLLLDWACTYEGKTESSYYEVTEFDVNTNIPDDTFDIPADAEMIDLTAFGERGSEMPDEVSDGLGLPPLPG